MIRFSAVTPDGPLFGFGLSRENIDLLIEGQPIKLNLSDIGGPEMFVVLMFGETDRAIFDELKSAKLIPAAVEFKAPTPGQDVVVHVRREEVPDVE